MKSGIVDSTIRDVMGVAQAGYAVVPGKAHVVLQYHFFISISTILLSNS